MAPKTPSIGSLVQFWRVAILVGSLGLVGVVQADQTITVRSGNGPVGTLDSQVRVLRYGRSTDITPSSADFITVQTAPFAYVVAPYGTYIQSLPSDPTAKWIATTPGLNPESALYAISFQVTDTVIASASLDLPYSVDNAINGVYINGTPISGNSHDGDYHGEYRFIRNDIAPLLRPNSINWLYLNVSDYGGLAALIFRATITVNGAPAGAQSISPDHGGNTGKVTVRVIGTGFEAGAQLKLTGVGPDIAGSSTTIVSTNILTSTLDLANTLPGLRTVWVANPSGATVTVPGGFTIEQGGTADIRIQKIGTPVVLGRNATYYITISNAGTIDSGVVPVAELVQPWFSFISSAPAPTTMTQLPDAFPPTATGGNYNAEPQWDLPNLAAGASNTISYTVLLDPSFPLGPTVHGTACVAYLDARAQCDQGYKNCWYSRVLPVCQAVAGYNLGICTSQIEYCEDKWVECLKANESPLLGGPCATLSTVPRGSVDPNDLTGPLGIGVPRWIPGSESMQYIIEFENLPAATKDATDVTVTDNLNPSLFDLSTLAVGAVSFGSSAYVPPNLPLLVAPFTTDIDLRPSRALIVRVHAALNPTTGQVTVTFVSIDPATGLPPSNPLVGFLPPGVGGSVLLTVMPKTGLVTGTTIQNQATVVFDFNPPINTPIWSNTIGPTVQCTGCYFTISGVRATLAFDVREVGSGSTFSYNYRTSAQTVQFVSTITSQIAVNGKSATFSGQGKLNGQTGYSFTVTAKDGGAVGSALDTVSIKITGPNNYSYTANGSIAGGDIVVKQ